TWCCWCRRSTSPGSCFRPSDQHDPYGNLDDVTSRRITGLPSGRLIDLIVHSGAVLVRHPVLQKGARDAGQLDRGRKVHGVPGRRLLHVPSGGVPVSQLPAPRRRSDGIPLTAYHRRRYAGEHELLFDPTGEHVLERREETTRTTREVVTGQQR